MVSSRTSFLMKELKWFGFPCACSIHSYCFPPRVVLVFFNRTNAAEGFKSGLRSVKLEQCIFKYHISTSLDDNYRVKL